MIDLLKNKKYVVLDIETTGLSVQDDSVVSVAFWSGGKSKFIPVYHKESHCLPQESIKKIMKIIDSVDLIVGHNIKFDLKFLMELNINFTNKLIWDTGVAEYILTSQQEKIISLKDLIKKYSQEQEKGFIDFKNINAQEVHLEDLKEYNLQDTKITNIIFQKQLEKVGNNVKLRNLIIGISSFGLVLADIEKNGVKIDTELLKKKNAEIQNRIKLLEQEMIELLGEDRYDWINFNSNQHLSAILFGGIIKIKCKSGIKIRTLKSGQVKVYPVLYDLPFYIDGLGFSKKYTQLTKQGYYNVSHDVINRLKGKTKRQKQFLEKYKLWRKLQTLQEKFFDKYLQFTSEEGYIYPNYNQTTTNTGRLSCNNPNIQQVPRKNEVVKEFNIKEVFISRFNEGYIVEIDFSQLEWRVCAYLCQDPVMIKEIKEGVDAHTQNASLAFHIPPEEVTKEHRQIAKMVSFGLIYGQSAYGMAKRVDIPINTEKEAQKIIDAVYSKYKNLKKWHNELYYQVLSKKKLVNVSGRSFIFNNPDKQITNIKNYPVQSFATADIVPLVFWYAWAEVKKKFQDKVYPINTVHDCIIFDCASLEVAKKVIKIVLTHMRNADKILYTLLGITVNIPLDGEAEVGENWANMQTINI